MKSAEAQGFGRFGGALLAVSLMLPYFAISFAGFAGVSFRLWTVDKGAFVLVAAFALMALAQVPISTRETTALIYLIVGAMFTAAIVYKVWISPPGSAPIGDLGGLGGEGSLSINGKGASISSLSTRDILGAMGIEMKASYGAFVAMVGSAFFTVGAFLDWRGGGTVAAPPQQFAQPPQYAAPQAYAGQPTAPQPQAQPQARSFPEDPFAPGNTPAAPQPPAQAAPQPPPAAPPQAGPPAPPRPPGS
jgi:hypothetical protein